MENVICIGCKLRAKDEIGFSKHVPNRTICGDCELDTDKLDIKKDLEKFGKCPVCDTIQKFLGIFLDRMIRDDTGLNICMLVMQCPNLCFVMAINFLDSEVNQYNFERYKKRGV